MCKSRHQQGVENMNARDANDIARARANAEYDRARAAKRTAAAQERIAAALEQIASQGLSPEALAVVASVAAGEERT